MGFKHVAIIGSFHLTTALCELGGKHQIGANHLIAGVVSFVFSRALQFSMRTRWLQLKLTPKPALRDELLF